MKVINSLSNKNSKSQLFIFDMIFSFTILILLLSFYYFYYLDTIDNHYIYELDTNILNGLTNTQINSLNNNFVRNLFIQGEIDNVENTVAEQIVSFYIDNKFNDSKNLTKLFVKDYIQPNLNFKISIENLDGSNYLELYRYPELPNPFTVDIDDASVVATNERLIYYFKNESTFYGPYKFKVVIWK